MIFVNEAYKAPKIYIGIIEGLVKLISPICPHMGEELWEILGHNNTIAYESWPEYDEEKTKESVVTYAVSVNGKLRDKIEVEANTNSKEVEAIALSSSKIKAYTDGHQIVKVIVVPNKIVNIVIK
jgi:leucyl-tRNA synthetase